MGTNNLARNLKELRALRGMSQEYLAEEAGISLRTVQRIENKESVPNGETIKRISKALDITIDKLVGSHVINETNNIKSTIIFLKKRRSETKEKSEIRTLEYFIALLNNLEHKDLNSKQTEGIESYIKYLELDKIPSISTDMFKLKLDKFKKFLKTKMNFVPNNYYTRLGVSFTIPFVIGFGVTNRQSLTKTIIVIIIASLLILIGVLADLKIKKQDRSLRF